MSTYTVHIWSPPTNEAQYCASYINVSTAKRQATRMLNQRNGTRAEVRHSNRTIWSRTRPTESVSTTPSREQYVLGTLISLLRLADESKVLRGHNPDTYVMYFGIGARVWVLPAWLDAVLDDYALLGTFKHKALADAERDQLRTAILMSLRMIIPDTITPVQLTRMNAINALSDIYQHGTRHYLAHEEAEDTSCNG